MSDIDRIVTFFLDLFRLESQKPGLRLGPAKFRVIDSVPGNDVIYELRIQAGTEWKTRRMSICRLGEEVESKSTCYKVIYDDQMVIKIPPRPITDFAKYLEQIHSDRHIAHQLVTSIPCVWPTLSAILAKIPGLLDTKAGTGPTLEEQCINLVTRTPALQSYLKIGSGFVFFMSLARNKFFNQVIEQIHDEKSRIKKEFIHSVRLFDSLEAFEAVYGEACDAVFFSINRLCREFQKSINALLTEDDARSLATYKTREWFFAQLTEEPPDMSLDLTSPEVISQGEKIFSSLMDKNETAIAQFRRMVEQSLRKQIFTSHRTTMEGLVISILKLLYRLQAREVAVRDLKSDNIFIAGHPDDSTHYLWDHELYDLGLIDLETAINTKPEKPDVVNQPSLAGTPSYMTPTHIFKNPILEAVLDAPLANVMYFQDWFAALGMIYNTVTGRLLFVKTAQLVPQIVQMKKTALIQKKPLVRLFQHVSRTFWDTADKEFTEKLGQARHRFNTLQLRLPGAISVMLKSALQNENFFDKQSMETLIRTRTHLKKDGRYLMEASADDVAAHRKKLQLQPVQPTTDDREKIIADLKKLEQIKRRLDHHDLEVGLFGRPMRCYDLVVFLMNRIKYVMHPPSREE
jgi:hypothetical protein